MSLYRQLLCHECSEPATNVCARCRAPACEPHSPEAELCWDCEDGFAAIELRHEPDIPPGASSADVMKAIAFPFVVITAAVLIAVGWGLGKLALITLFVGQNVFAKLGDCIGTLWRRHIARLQADSWETHRAGLRLRFIRGELSPPELGESSDPEFVTRSSPAA